MLGIDPLIAQTLIILAAANGAPACTMPAPTKINIVPKTAEVKYDTSKTIAQMQKLQGDTVDPYSFHQGMSTTQGLMQGMIELRYAPKIVYETDQRTGMTCIWYESIDIEFNIAPTILIAKEIHADPCMGKAVADHEMQHVKADRAVVNKYAKAMGQRLHSEIGKRGFSAGPMSMLEAKAVGARMQKTVQQLVDWEYKKMEIERVEAQNAIDSLEEYKRVNALCPNYKPGSNPGAAQKKVKYQGYERE